MKFFIDTANLAQIREANEMGVLDGVTTNPSLMAKENIRGEEACRRHYLEICSIVDGDVSADRGYGRRRPARNTASQLSTRRYRRRIVRAAAVRSGDRVSIPAL